MTNTHNLLKLILTVQLLKCKGKWWRNPLSNKRSKKQQKKRISIALDPDVLQFFQEQAGEKGYQTLINQTLESLMVHEHFKNDLHQVVREELHGVRLG